LRTDTDVLRLLSYACVHTYPSALQHTLSNTLTLVAHLMMLNIWRLGGINITHAICRYFSNMSLYSFHTSCYNELSFVIRQNISSVWHAGIILLNKIYSKQRYKQNYKNMNFQENRIQMFL